VNCRSTPWARPFTSTTPTGSKIQASTCHQLLSPKFTKKVGNKVYQLLLPNIGKITVTFEPETLENQSKAQKTEFILVSA